MDCSSQLVTNSSSQTDSRLYLIVRKYFFVESFLDLKTMDQKSPELVGIYEARKILNDVSNQYINQLVKEGKLAPHQQLRCGKIFLKSEVDRFKQLRKSKNISSSKIKKKN